MPQADLVIRGLTKVFETDAGPVTAVEDVNIEVEGDEFFSLLGPSGCGKTTTLRMIAGLETITSGDIRFRGRDLAGLPSAQRNLGMVFQSYALFPHLTVFENAAYGLKIRKTRAVDTGKRVTELLAALGLGGLQGRYPADLSGGQQQRVSIARALAYEPDMFLLDEPLANLDAKLRIQMREEIRRIQKDLGVLALYVTHDQEEAMAVSDRIGVFNLGRLMQVGTPAEVYKDPTSLFVADFIGKINFFGAEVVGRDAAGGAVRLGVGGSERHGAARTDPARTDAARADATQGQVAASDPVPMRRFRALDARERQDYGVTTPAVVAVRPEHLRLEAIEPTDAPGPGGSAAGAMRSGSGGGSGGASRGASRGTLHGTVRRVLFLGSVTRTFVTCDAAMREVVAEDDGSGAPLHEGQEVAIGFDPDDAICFGGDTP